MPLYTDGLSAARRSALLVHCDDERAFKTAYPVPSVPIDRPEYRDLRYWSGPTWVNINWHLIDGLARSGEAQRARDLRRQTLDMVATGGMHEYFSASAGRGLGFDDFAWTAALAIDLIRSE
jgi:glycogen debranching enzyme